MNWRPEGWQNPHLLAWFGDDSYTEERKATRDVYEAGADAMLQAVIPMFMSLGEDDLKQALASACDTDILEYPEVLLYRLCQAQLDKILALLKEERQ